MNARSASADALSKYAAKDFFAYTINIQTLAPAGTRPGQFTIDANCDFLWTKGTLLAFDDTGGGPTSIMNLVITITDTSTGRNLMNVPLPAPCLFGTGQLPFILPTPKLFAARSTVTINALNNDPATTFGNIYFGFIGTQLFLR